MKKNYLIKGTCIAVSLLALTCVATNFNTNSNASAFNNVAKTSTIATTAKASNKKVFKDHRYPVEYAVTKDGTYEIKCTPSKGNAYWDIYVLDEQFDDALRYLPQAYQPSYKATKKAQKINLKKVQYVYAICSVNANTDSVKNFKCPLTIEFKKALVDNSVVVKGNKTTFNNYLYPVEYSVKKSGTYTIKCNPSKRNAYWDIYVLDEQFDDALRYLPQAHQPKYKATKKTQKITLKKGQYVYAICSVNANTGLADQKFKCPLTVEFKK